MYNINIGRYEVENYKQSKQASIINGGVTEK